ncbi:hypothetical protein [Flavisolibacter ginsenosidimutans]|uniref:T9SS type A sorting domain-containing protein n=1 Tax=Flavisolibacter ginsenosidimutans TaxID=661481 RepID=A0A5B8UMP4_9BACT|nr:hypothetical protein [Flavisolibacter ginsenosidimutans]QEC57340.1 hypothetical protein FSB75_16010 [Flavisolibacter ginsenosidimutans]
MKRFTLACLAAALLCAFYFFRPQVPTLFKTENEEENELLESGNKLRYIEEAIRQEFELTKSPVTGDVPRYKLLQAMDYTTQRLQQRTQSRAIQGVNWVERGPNNIGGRTLSLLFDANDADYSTVYAGAADGGLWRCLDINAVAPVWNKVSDQFDNLAVSTIAQQANNPAKMYFGTGEGYFNVDAVQGFGIWRSLDNGTTWQHLPSTTDGNFRTVQKIVVTNNGYVYAATTPGGIMRSKDGGITWEKVLGGGPGADLEIAANGNLWASIGIFSPGSVWTSATGDAGSWTNKTPPANATNGMQRITIACAPSDANTVYVLGHDGNSNDCNNIWYSNNAGTLWTPRVAPLVTDQVATAPNFTRGQAWYDLPVAVDPNNPLSLVIGGVDLHRSIDAGATWIHISKWYNSIATAYPLLPVVHADQHAIVFSPGSSDKILFGNDGGIFLSPNITAALSDVTVATVNAKNNGYNVTQFYAVAQHPANQNYFLAGAQDNGSQKFSGGTGTQATSEASGGDGAFCHIDQQDPNYQFTSYVYNNYYRSTDGGVTFNSTVSNSSNGSFVNPTALDNTSKMLYADYTTVSTRVGGQFGRWDTRSSSTSMDAITVTNFANASVTHVAVSPNVANRIYFGLSNGRIVYVDGANTASGTVAGTIVRTGTGSVSGIAIEPGNEAHMLITYANYDVQNVLETFDGGTTWTNVEGNLPNMPVRWVVFNPSNYHQAFIATELGVWSTDNLAGTSTEWNPTNGGFANVRVDMLKIVGNQMAAATHGRGLFTTTLAGTANAPAVNFGTSSGAGSEAAANVSTGCDKGYKDYPVTMYISDAPTGTATVNLNVVAPTATATEGQDYDIIPKTLTFSSGSNAPQSFVIRVYNDANTEAQNEFFTIDYTISGTTNAVKGGMQQTYDFRIADDDYLKIPKAATTVSIPSGIYNTNLGGSSPLQGSQSDKKMQYLYRKDELLAMGLKAGPITSLSFVVGTKGSVQPFMGLTILMGSVSASLNNVNAGFVSTAGFTTVYSAPITGFNSVAGENKFAVTTPFNWDGTSNIIVQFCYNNLAAPPAAPVALPAGSGDDILQGETDPKGQTCQVRAVSTNVPTDDGCAFTTPTLVSYYRPLLYFEQARTETPVQTILNRSKAAYLGPNEDVYFYDETDGKLLARIQNLTSLDYGCTTVQIDRQVNGSVYAQPFWSNNAANYVTSKSFKVIPSQNGNNPGGQYKITLYYTDAEKTGYTSVTGKSWTNTEMVRVTNGFYVPDVSPSNQHVNDVTSVTMIGSSVGTNWTATGQFLSALASGFAVGATGVNSPLPTSLLSFTGRLQNDYGQLAWTVASEDSKGYSIEKSTDGSNFTAIGFVNAQGGSAAQKQYSFTDPTKAGTVQFYRLAMVSATGTTKYSNIIKLQKNSIGIGVQVYPTLVKDIVNIKYSQPTAEKVSIELYNFLGARVIMKSTSLHDEQVNIGTMPGGSYQLVIRLTTTGESLYSGKIIKQ